MVRHIHVVGIGAGNPDHVSAEAVAVLGCVDVVFVVDKPGAVEELAQVRRTIFERHLPGVEPRWVQVPEVARDRRPADYDVEVRRWHRQRADRFEAAMLAELDDDGTGAILVWGDPSLYDSTLRILEDLAERGTVAFTHDVVPGITSISMLAAAHRMALHRIGESMLVTTGRRLVEDDGWPEGIANVVVMLDGVGAHGHLAARPAGADLTIWWGAYLGTPHQLLRSGPLTEVSSEIERTRAAAREEHGWIMDIYLLRRPAR